MTKTTQLINRLNKKVSAKLSEEEFQLLKVKLVEVNDFVEDLKAN